MKSFLVLLIVSTLGCINTSDNKNIQSDSTGISANDGLVKKEYSADSNFHALPDTAKQRPPGSPGKVYANKRFRNVTAETLGGNKFRIKGEGQIFEASFSWIIEDGHNEIKKGFHTTDAGAPEWGKFEFTVDAVKQRENSTLHIILFETSAKDGSRQYKLPIKLY